MSGRQFEDREDGVYANEFPHVVWCAVPLLDELFCCGLVAVVDAVDVYFEHSLEVVFGQFEEGFDLGDSCVGDPVGGLSKGFEFCDVDQAYMVFRLPSSFTAVWIMASTSLSLLTSAVATHDFLPSFWISWATSSHPCLLASISLTQTS